MLVYGDRVVLLLKRGVEKCLSVVKLCVVQVVVSNILASVMNVPVLHIGSSAVLHVT